VSDPETINEPEQQAPRYLVVFVICFGSLLSPLSLSSVNVAIPSMAAALQADAFSISLMPTVFLLSNVALLLSFAKLADNYGRKRVYAAGLAVNASASFGAYLSGSIEWILLFRCIQGAGSAMVFSSALAIITSVFPNRQRGLPLGLNTAAVYCGLTIAPALGGLVTDTFGWRAVFLLPVPPVLFLLLVIRFKLKAEWRHERHSPFDWQGALLYAGWTISLVIGLTGLPAVPSIFALALAIGLLALFLKHQSRHPEPLVNLALFRNNPLFTRSLSCSAFMYAGTYPLVFLLSLYLQYIVGLEAFAAGKVLLFQTVAMALLAPLAGRLSDRVEPRIISTLGCLNVALGMALLTQLSSGTSPFYTGCALFLIGIGFGLFSPPNNNAIMSAVGTREIGVASATVNLARVTGNLVGVSLMNLVVRQLLGATEITPEHHLQLLSAVNTAMYLSLALVLVGTFFSAKRGRMKRVS
jgi:EmrB/QacA subfamily drug resistance transporter